MVLICSYIYATMLSLFSLEEVKNTIKNRLRFDQKGESFRSVLSNRTLLGKEHYECHLG